jgi:hypothetical protein
MRNPLDPFSKVVDEQSHWDPEWYSWITDVASTATKSESNITALQAQIAALQAAVATIQQPGMILIQSQTVTNVGSIVFNNLSNTAYDHYIFYFHIRGSTPDNVLNVRTGYDNGASFNTTAYWWTWNYVTSYSAGVNLAQTQVASSIQVSGSGRANDEANGTLHFWPSNGSSLNFFEGSSVYLNSSGMVNAQMSGIDSFTNAAANAVQFIGGGNLTGRINLYGMRKTV